MSVAGKNLRGGKESTATNSVQEETGGEGINTRAWIAGNWYANWLRGAVVVEQSTHGLPSASMSDYQSVLCVVTDSVTIVLLLDYAGIAILDNRMGKHASGVTRH